VLVTKVDNKIPVSSSSQPSLMAIMIVALRVAPGQHILEIGAGTGYNAALLASLGATIISIDVQEDVAVRARSALARAGISHVRVEHGDGYAGHPGDRFDRVIVTVGIGGFSPQWLAQLTPGGFVLAPVKHAGSHPVLVVSGPPEGPVTGTPVCPAGFMLASGPLTADHPGAFPFPAGPLTDLLPVMPPRFDPPLDEIAYRDLWYAAGAWNRRASHVAVPGREQGCVALLDENRTGGAVIFPDGSIHAAGSSDQVEPAAIVLDRWIAAGRPKMQAWRVSFTLTGDPDAPIWAPDAWELS
jgi:protein-L-isoaspartate(D-aspartate) O-methyltransferase